MITLVIISIINSLKFFWSTKCRKIGKISNQKFLKPMVGDIIKVLVLSNNGPKPKNVHFTTVYHKNKYKQ